MLVGDKTLYVTGYVRDHNCDWASMMETYDGQHNTLFINLSDYRTPTSYKFNISDYNGVAPKRSQVKFVEIAKLIVELIDGSDASKIVMFCNQGQQRSAAVAAYYLRHKLGLSFNEAIEAVKNVRPQAFEEHITFEPSLRDMN